MRKEPNGFTRRTTVLAATMALGLFGLSAPVSRAAPQTAASAPQPNWYNVELIVFRNTDTRDAAQETWPADPGQPDWNGAVTLNPPDSIGPAVPYQLLSPVNQQLDDDWKRLKRSRDYEPLLHLAWTQPALDRATAPAVRVGVPPSAAPQASTATAPAAFANPAATAPPLVATPVYGNAKLSTTGPYLHFDLDLDYQGPPLSTSPATGATTAAGLSMDAVTPATHESAAAAPAFQFYRLDQDRRIDLGKLNYFDNPMFGVLVLVTPVKQQ